MWDTSGSTNFDSVRPLSYSEVARKTALNSAQKIAKNYHFAGWHLPNMLQHCRAHLPLQCPKSLGCWGEEECEKMRWNQIVEKCFQRTLMDCCTNIILHILDFVNRLENTRQHLCSCVGVSQTWGGKICLNLIIEFSFSNSVFNLSMNLYWPVLDLILKQQQDYLAPARPLSP